MADRGIIAFTDNVSDRSNEDGFQFEFYCERCGNGYRSPFVTNKMSMGRNLLRGAGQLFGGGVERLGYAADQLDRSTNSAAKDRALAAAVEAVRPEFRQCRGCGNWVCAQVCWNEEVGQCLVCSPSVVDEISKAQAAAQVEQIQEKARTVDWTKDLDIQNRAKVRCPSCSASVQGGKFCPECGERLSVKV